MPAVYPNKAWERDDMEREMGDDSCFESHATQPRATLIDCCSGGFMHWQQREIRHRCRTI